MFHPTIAAALAAVALSAVAMPAAAADLATARKPERVTSLVVYGSDPCPRSSDEEIVVCGREPEGERYRVPKRFRGKKQDAGGRSWSDRVQTLEYVGRVGTPNSCSPVGSGGQTGCFQQFLRQARDERRQAEAEAAQIP